LQITRVELKNIKNHADAAWSFAPGVVAICGPNGSGKTTILESIAWVLFDHLDYSRDDFVRRGTKRGQAAVAFLSDLDEREYIVTRDTGGGYSAFDPTTGARLAEQKNQVIPWLRQHIGVPPETDLATLFKTTIGVPQGAFTYDFNLAPTPRRKVFDHILHVEEFRQASDKLRDSTTYIKERQNDIERGMAEAEGELKIWDEVSHRHTEAAAKISELQKELQTVQARRDQLADELQRLDALQSQVTDQRTQVERQQGALELHHNKLSAAQQAFDSANAATVIVNAVRSGYERWLKAAETLQSLEAQRHQRDTLRQQEMQTEREAASIHSQGERVSEKLREIAAAKTTVQQLSSDMVQQQALENEIAQLREARGEAQSLQREMASLEATLEKLRTQYSEISRELEKTESLRGKAENAGDLKVERANLTEELRQKELALASFKTKRELIAERQQELHRLDKESGANAGRLAQLEPLSQAAAKLKECEVQWQAESHRLAVLQAEIVRDENMMEALESGGVCPLLTEKCLNLKPGESLDARFRRSLSQRRQETVVLEKHVSALAEAAEKLRAQSAEAAQLPKLREEKARLDKVMAERRAELAKLENEVLLGRNVSDGEIKQLKNKLLGIEAQLHDADEAQKIYSKAQPLKRQLQEVKKEGEARKKEHESLLARRQKMGDVEKLLEVAQQKLNALNDPRGRAAALQQLIGQQSELEKSASVAEKKSAEINLQLQEIHKQLISFARLDAEMTETRAAQLASEKDHQAFIANEKTALLLESCSAELQRQQEECTQAEKWLSAATARLRELEQQYNAALHRETQTALTELRERITQVNTHLAHIQAEFDRLSENLAKLATVRERVKEQMMARDKTRKLHETTEFIRETLQKAAPFISEMKLATISLAANELFREITGRYDVTLRWANDYEIILEEQGYDRPFANLSGGEQMSAALAVRLALLQHQSDIKIAFFDEPTTNMDEDRRRNLAQQIGRVSAFHQLFVISHDDSFESFTDQVITLTAKEES
jgi:exonuclease SbcC